VSDIKAFNITILLKYRCASKLGGDMLFYICLN